MYIRFCAKYQEPQPPLFQEKYKSESLGLDISKFNESCDVQYGSHMKLF